MEINHQNVKGDKKKDPESVSLWFDMDNGKYYVLNNVTGEKKRVNKTGEYIKKFNADLTGQVNFQQRVDAAKGDPQYMPFAVPSEGYRPNKSLYTPQNDKFQGYSQFPKPRTQPYTNQLSEFSLNREKRSQIKKIQSAVKLINPMNSSTYEYSGEKATALPLSFSSKQDSELANTQRKNLLNTLNHNQSVKEEKKKKEQQDKEIAEGRTKSSMRVDEVINHKRYTEKVKSFNEKTCGFSSISTLQQSAFNTFSTLEQKRLHSIDTMFSKLEGLQTKTFEKEIKLNFNPNQTSPNLHTIKEFNDNLHLNSLLRNQQLPEIKEKLTVTTKGRFGYNLPSDKVLNDASRKIMLQNFPEYFVEKIDTKKQMLKEQRRELLKKVIEEMLIQNVKNKV